MKLIRIKYSLLINLFTIASTLSTASLRGIEEAFAQDFTQMSVEMVGKKSKKTVSKTKTFKNEHKRTNPNDTITEL